MGQGSQIVAPAPPATPTGTGRSGIVLRCLRWPRSAHWVRWAAPIALALPIALAAGGCRADPPLDRQPGRIGAEAEWAWLLAARHRLDAERAQLEALGGTGAAPAPPPPAAAGTLSPRDRLAREADALAQQFGRRLVAYINANPPVE